MAKDVIARLKADTRQWDSGLAKATRSLNKFQQENMSLDAALQGSVKTITSVAAKYVGWGAAVTGAMKVAKDAFMSNESQVDAWGRTMEASQSIYDSFVTSLNNGSLSGWFSNMDNLIDKARQAYDAIDELNTKMTIISPERVKIQGMISEQKEIIRKSGKNSDAGKAAAEEIKRLEPQLKATYKQEAKMNYNAFEAEVQKKLAGAGINLDKNSYSLLMRSFSSTEDYERLRAGAKTTERGTGRYNLDEMGHAVGPEITETVRNTNQKLLDLFTDEWRKANSGYLTASYSAKNSSYQVGIQDARYTGASNSNTPTTTAKVASATPAKQVAEEIIPSGSILEIEKKIAYLRNALRNATTQEARDSFSSQIDAANTKLDIMTGKIGEIQGLEVKFQPIELDFGGSNIDKVAKSVQTAADAFQQLGAAMSGIEDPGAKVAGYIASAIGSVVAGYGAATAQAGKTGGPWGWIAFAATGLATMISTITAIKSATAEYHAEGGIVGNSPFIPRGTDTVPAMLTPGEIVLSAANQQNIASALSASRGETTTEIRFKGEEMVAIINAFGRRSRRGEILKG